MKKKEKTQIDELIDMVEEGLVREAGARLHSLGYQDLGETLMTVDPILAYVSSNREKAVLQKIIASLQKLKVTIAKAEEEEADKKEPSVVFSDIKKAMNYIKTKPEEEKEKIREESKKDDTEGKKLEPVKVFQHLSVADRIGLTHGDVIVVGSMYPIAQALHETPYLVDRLSTTEGIIRAAPVVGVRKDVLYVPAYISSKKKTPKKKKKKKESDWREEVHKKKTRMILKDQVYAIVARTYPEFAIVVDFAILSKDHYYFLLLPKLITQEPYTKFQFGVVRSPIKVWSILGID
jgi:hypothetical protein